MSDLILVLSINLTMMFSIRRAKVVLNEKIKEAIWLMYSWLRTSYLRLLVFDIHY